MEINLSFPWTKMNLDQLLIHFKLDEKLVVNWNWAPYYRAGIDTLRWAAKTGISREVIEQEISNLSRPVPAAPWKKSMEKLRVLDEEGRFKIFDSEISIRETIKKSQSQLGNFADADLILPTISDLRNALEGLEKHWQPCLEKLDEFKILSKALTGQKVLLKRFQDISLWDKLELLEIFVGSIKSSSALEFERIVFYEAQCYK